LQRTLRHLPRIGEKSLQTGQRAVASQQECRFSRR
jgi:hypothetical protein